MTAHEPNRRGFLGTLLGAAGVLAPGTATARRGPSAADTPVHETYAVDVFPGAPGDVWVQLSVEPVPGLDELSYELPPDVSVIAHRGFDPLEGRLLWDGSDYPQITYTTSPSFGWAADDGWGFVRKTGIVLDAPGVETARSFAFPRGGHGHPDLAGQSYVGPSETVTRHVAEIPTTYVRPGLWHAPAAPPPDLYFDVVDATAGMLSLADPLPAIGYASPLLDGSNGVAKRGATADTARPHFAFDQRSPGSIAHEYVHTQQDYFVAREYRWLLEGVATFYEHCVGYRYGLRELSPIDGSSTPDPLRGARRAGVVYEKGAALCFLLDRELRDLRNGTVALGDVLQALNEHDNSGARSPTIDHETFKDVLAEAAAARFDGWLDERVAGPYEVALPENLATGYPDPDAPRPSVQSIPREVTASGPDNWLQFGFDVATREEAVAALDLTVTATSPGVVRLGDLEISADDGEYEVADRGRSRRSRSLSLTVEYPVEGAPDSLVATPPVGVRLDPVGTGATALRISGSVTYHDGETEPLATGIGGTRALVASDPPPEPSVVPRTVPAGDPVDLYVADPEPDVVYLWDFAGDGRVQGIGPRVTRPFGLLGETTVGVTAVDRSGNRTTGSTTLQVTENDGPTVLGDADEDCLVREQAVRRRAADPAAGGTEGWLLRDALRRCYTDD